MAATITKELACSNAEIGAGRERLGMKGEGYTEKGIRITRRAWLFALSSLITLIVVCLSLVYPSLLERKLTSRYGSLNLNISREDVDAHLRMTPSVEFRRDNLVVCYYGRNVIDSWRRFDADSYRTAMRTGFVEAPPFIYGSVQVLWDADRDRVLAKTVCGEEYELHTVYGSIPYGNLSDLPSSVESQLVGDKDGKWMMRE